MPNDISPMHQYFAKLGLEPETADIYLALHAYGRQSLFQLARNSRIERTRLYRLVETLIDLHLVEVESEYKRKIYRAAPIDNLQILLTKKEHEIRELGKELIQLQRQYAPQLRNSPPTRIQAYKGIEGIKQMLWNETRGQSDNLSILYENMQSRTNLSFFERWVQRLNEQGIACRSIVSDHFLETQKEWYAKHDNQKILSWEGRYLPDTVMPIRHSTVVYDDVVAYYNWQDGEVFGMEMYNDQIAASQKNIFEMLWIKALPIPGHGEK